MLLGRATSPAFLPVRFHIKGQLPTAWNLRRASCPIQPSTLLPRHGEKGPLGVRGPTAPHTAFLSRSLARSGPGPAWPLPPTTPRRGRAGGRRPCPLHPYVAAASRPGARRPFLSLATGTLGARLGRRPRVASSSPPSVTSLRGSPSSSTPSHGPATGAESTRRPVHPVIIGRGGRHQLYTGEISLPISGYRLLLGLTDYFVQNLYPLCIFTLGCVCSRNENV